MKMTLRALHRWLGLVSSILFMGIAITALGLQVDLWTVSYTHLTLPTIYSV